ncbi:MAG: quinone-dependent dihydroorotate dehydrogenase [Verrucomicrobiia bacterium]
MISWTYQNLLRPAFFAMDAEKAHVLAMKRLSFIARHRFLLLMTRLACGAPRLRQNVFGLEFENPVGLAAGFDKNAEALPVWEALGFGFIEIGTVTAVAQPGNPQPRLFRFPRQKALLNRMGFNNDGADAIAERLKMWKKRRLWPRVPVGINIGKSKVTDLEDAPADYAYSFSRLREYGDYFVVNISSPNTPGLRSLQEAGALERLLLALDEENQPGPHRKPLLVKLSPDLLFEDIADLLDTSARRGVDGFVISNTTTDLSPIADHPAACEGGGLSGAPLRKASNSLIAYVSRKSGLPIIGVGGVFDAETAMEKIAAGASLVQTYTGFVYNGPTMVAQIVRGLIKATAQ